MILVPRSGMRYSQRLLMTISRVWMRLEQTVIQKLSIGDLIAVQRLLMMIIPQSPLKICPDDT